MLASTCICMHTIMPRERDTTPQADWSAVASLHRLCKGLSLRGVLWSRGFPGFGFLSESAASSQTRVTWARSLLAAKEGLYATS